MLVLTLLKFLRPFAVSPRFILINQQALDNCVKASFVQEDKMLVRVSDHKLHNARQISERKQGWRSRNHVVRIPEATEHGEH
jgi:hypothetical protein